MKRVHSLKELGRGFSEIENNHPEHPFELLAGAVMAGRMIKADRVELVEEFNGQTRRIVVPIVGIANGAV